MRDRRCDSRPRVYATWLRLGHVNLVTLMVLCMAPAAARGQTWSTAQRLNEAGESPQGGIKKPEVCRASGGGFHVVYRHHLNGGAGTPMKSSSSPGSLDSIPPPMPAG